MRAIPVVSVFAASFLLSPIAQAAGLSIPDLGARALGQGAATIAAPDDLSAIYYNPAGLAGHGGTRFMVDLRAVRHELSFQRLDENGENPEDWSRVRNGGGWLVAPMVGVSHRLTLGRVPVAIALGGYPASGYSGYEFPDGYEYRQTLGKGGTAKAKTAEYAPQRYSMVSQNSLSYTVALAASARVLPWLDVGVSIQNPYVRFRSSQLMSADALTQVPDENADYDARLRMDATDAVTLTGALGATARLPHGVVLGASFQLPAEYRAKGSLKVDLPKILEEGGVSVQGDRAELRMKTPWFARVGARLVREAFEAEFAFTWDGWSRYDAISIVPDGIKLQTPDGTKAFGSIRLPKEFQDAQSVRLGGVLRPGAFVAALDWLSVSAGVLAETSAVKDERIALDHAHWARAAAGVGLGAKLRWFDIRLSYAHFFQPDKSIRNSANLQSAPLQPELATVVGNGDYASRIDVLGLSVSGAFGAR